MIARLRRLAAHPDRGLGLAELIVSMALTTIVLIAVGVLLTSGLRANSVSTSIGTNTQSASNAMNEMSRMLRAATTNPVPNQLTNSPAFVSVAPESMTFYAYVNLDSSAEQPMKVTFSLDTKRNLVETRTQAVAAGSGFWNFSGATTTRILAGPIAVTKTGATPLFSYRTDPVAGQVLGSVLSLAAPLTSDQLGSISAVTITAEIGSTTAGLPTNVVLSTTVGLPNTGN